MSIARAGVEAGLKVRRQVTESITRIVEQSLGQYFRSNWMLPRRLTQETGALRPVARWYARSVDGKVNGEAVITEFVK